MPDQSKHTGPSLFAEIPDLEEMRSFTAPPPDPPAVEMRDGHAVVVRRPKRPDEHLCLNCRHYWEYAHQRDAGPRPTKQIHVEFMSWCRISGEPFDLQDQTILVCNGFSRRRDLATLVEAAKSIARRVLPEWVLGQGKSNGSRNGHR